MNYEALLPRLGITAEAVYAARLSSGCAGPRTRTVFEAIKLALAQDNEGLAPPSKIDDIHTLLDEVLRR